MGEFEVDLALLYLQRAWAEGRSFLDVDAIRTYLKDEAKLADDYLSRLSDGDLVNCLLRNSRGAVTQPAPTPPASSSNGQAESVIEATEDDPQTLPSFDPSEPTIQVLVTLPRNGDFVRWRAKLCKQSRNFIEKETVEAYKLNPRGARSVMLSYQLPGVEKALRGRFFIVPGSALPTNLALGTGSRNSPDQSDDEDETPGISNLMEEPSIAARDAQALELRRDTFFGADISETDLAAELIYKICDIHGRKRLSGTRPFASSEEVERSQGSKRQRNN